MDNQSIRTVSCGFEVFNMDLLTLLLLTGAIALLYYYLVREAGKMVDGKICPPGPRWIPFVGNGRELKRLVVKLGGQYEAFSEMAKKYNTRVLGLTLGSDYYVVVFTEDLIREIVTRDEFQARPDNFFIRLRTMGTKKGVTMTDGDFWHEQRQFLIRHLRSLGFGRTIMENLIQEELKGLFKKLGSGGAEVNLSQHLPKNVLNVLWSIATGSRFEPEDKRLHLLLEYMGRRSKAFDMAGGTLSQFPWLRFLAPERSGYNLIVSLNNELSQIIHDSIEEHKKSYREDVTRDFIDAFLHEMYHQKDQKNSTFTEEQLVSVCLDLFIAGSQTTSNTLDFALLQMIKRPEVQAKVQAEIDAVLGHGELPKMNDRARMPYVEAVLMESQRLNHVTPLNGPRRVLKNTTLDGYYIPKGTTVLLGMVSVQKDPVKFKEPFEFRPERFLDDKGEFLSEVQFFQFGFGLRRCPGEALAKNFLFLFFTGILQHYKLSVVKGQSPPSSPPVSGISLTPAPYKLSLAKRR